MAGVIRSSAQEEPDKVSNVSLREGRNVMPIPDPTALTTEALRREIQTLKELLLSSLAAVDQRSESRKDTLRTRLDALEKTIVALQAHADRDPSVEVMDQRVLALGQLHDEKFKSVASEFSLRDIRSEQASRDTKTAVDAALQAAEKAVNKQNESAALAIAKSEASTIKSIDQIAILLQSVAKASDDKVGDIKDRVALIEGRGVAQGSPMVALIMASLAVVISLVSIVVAISYHR